MSLLFRPFLTVLLIVHCSLLIEAQAPKTYTSSEILLGLKKLNVLGSVLYIAAHPDDENTRLIAYLANGRLVETGYLSCTRGDGGQNLIGPELREQLGVIRTQELLAARRIDGGRQFFTRANDFGFSKTSDETFQIWDKEQVLADMVWVIRQRRPDVLIARFPPDPRAGHGHHQASAILAAEAFDAAGDPKRFPEQLQYVQPWQPKRLLWNTGSFFVRPGENMDGYLKLDAGGYNPLLGQSYGEIAARSRSQHRSQGFGSSAQRGEAPEYFQLVKGEKATTDLFDGVDMTWNRVPGGAAVQKLIEDVIRNYDASNPAASVAGLLKVRAALEFVMEKELEYPTREAIKRNSYSLEKGLSSTAFWLGTKYQQINELLKASLGLHLAAIANESTVAAGQIIKLTREGLNSSTAHIMLGRYVYKSHASQNLIELPINKIVSDQVDFEVPTDLSLTQPYWLTAPSKTGMYKIDEQGINTLQGFGFTKHNWTPRELIGKPENPGSINVQYTCQVLAPGMKRSEDLVFDVPVQYKHTDPVLGEQYQPLAVVPPVAVNLVGQTYIFADNQPKTVPVVLRAGRADARGAVALQVPAGWKAEPASIPFELKNKDEERTVTFRVQPTTNQESSGQLRAVATLDGQQYSRGIQTINYTHIPTQTLFPEAVAPLVKLDLKRRKQEIGYLMGAGDEVPEALRQLGYTVTLLKPEDLTLERLRRFETVVLGIRAYNTIDRLKALQPELLRYAEQGGTVLVQYVVSRGTVLPEIGPYPLTLSNDRVTVENAPVTFLKPQHPLLNSPNKISSQDFAGWVQEQGLYYPSKWDAKYETIISSHDPGETAKESAILVADYGKGHYIYTGLSFFRELPAGVPGAYRLITNLIELGGKK